MINIYLTKNSITIDGHADYAESGKDIVCAAVSAVLQTTQIGLIQMAIQYPHHIKLNNDIVKIKEIREEIINDKD